MQKGSNFKLVVLIGILSILGAVGLAKDDEVATEIIAAEVPVYTSAQAEAGYAVYQQSCDSCHFNELQGDNFAAPLAGRSFLNYWSGRTLEQFLDYVRTQMPLGSPGSISDEAYAQVVAYILEYNGFPDGDSELATDPQELSGIVFGRPDVEE